MGLEGEAVPGKRSHRFGVVLVEFQPGEDLGAHALDRARIDARLGQRQAQQVEGLVLVGREHLHIAEHHVAARVESHAHGERLQALLKGDGVETARALVHHAGDEISEPCLVLGVLCSAAAKCKAHGDQGIDVALDEPGLDAAGACDALDVHGVNRRAGSAAKRATAASNRIPTRRNGRESPPRGIAG